MVMPHPRPSVTKRSIHRELERRRPKPLAPKGSAIKKPSAPLPSSREDSHGKIHKPGPRPVREKGSSIVSMARRSSASTHPPPPSRPRHQAPAHPPFAASASSAPPHRSASAPLASICVTTSSIGSHMKPGTRVQVRMRTKAKIDGKTLVLWLTATVVSATDGGYEIIYDGKLPLDDPMSTVHVPLHDVRPIKQSPPPVVQPPRAAATSRASAASKMQSRPSAAGKSNRLVSKAPAPPSPTSTKVLPARRPTTAGKSLRIIRKFWPELELPPCTGNDTEVAALKNPKMLSAPRSTPAGKVASLLHARASKMKPTPRSSTPALKSMRHISNLSPEIQHTPRPTTGKSQSLMCGSAPEMKPAPRPTTAGKSIKVVERILTEMKCRVHFLDD